MHAIVGNQKLQLVKSPDLFAFVRRVRNTVRQIDQLGRGIAACEIGVTPLAPGASNPLVNVSHYVELLSCARRGIPPTGVRSQTPVAGQFLPRNTRC